eukprot:scaffold8036_cov128-Isochrysis_galbana.AAC.5
MLPTRRGEGLLLFFAPGSSRKSLKDGRFTKGWPSGLAVHTHNARKKQKCRTLHIPARACTEGRACFLFWTKD